MPIYPYLCGACGHQEDVLQKISAPVLTQCTQCGADSFKKQLSAPSFQLKGSGWYVTDFRENGKKPDAKEGAAKEGGEIAAAAPAATSEGTATAAPASAPATVASPAPAAAPAPAPAKSTAPTPPAAP
jgi:putative FmdB family regulatory protein